MSLNNINKWQYIIIIITRRECCILFVLIFMNIIIINIIIGTVLIIIHILIIHILRDAEWVVFVSIISLSKQQLAHELPTPLNSF